MIPNARLALAACVPVLLALAMPSAARAASPPSFGTAVISLDGPASSSLRARGVKVVAAGRELRAGKRLTVRVKSGSVAAQAELGLASGFTLRTKRRSVALTGLLARLTAGRSSLSARIAGRRHTLFAIASRPRLLLDATRKTVVLNAAPLALTPAGAGVLRRALGMRRLSSGRFGTLTIRATLAAAPPATGPGAPGTGSPENPGPQPPGGGTPPPPPPPPIEPPRLARPATAVAITTATVTWHVRDSFVQYIAGGGGGATAQEGATAQPAEVRPGSVTPLVYAFGFPPASTGWYDPPSATAAVYFSGAVRFVYPERFDFQAHDPEIEINGGASRAIFRFTGSGASTFANRRGVLVDLKPLPAPAVSGSTATYTAIPGVIPAGSATSVFGDFYVPGDDFGSFTVSFTTG